jgi:hypothetical protein
VLVADDLDDNPVDWQPLGPDLPATGNTLTITDPIGARPQRFYRILQVD